MSSKGDDKCKPKVPKSCSCEEGEKKEELNCPPIVIKCDVPDTLEFCCPADVCNPPPKPKPKCPPAPRCPEPKVKECVEEPPPPPPPPVECDPPPPPEPEPEPVCLPCPAQCCCPGAPGAASGVFGQHQSGHDHGGQSQGGLGAHAQGGLGAHPQGGHDDHGHDDHGSCGVEPREDDLGEDGCTPRPLSMDKD